MLFHEKRIYDKHKNLLEIRRYSVDNYSSTQYIYHSMVIFMVKYIKDMVKELDSLNGFHQILIFIHKNIMPEEE